MSLSSHPRTSVPPYLRKKYLRTSERSLMALGTWILFCLMFYLVIVIFIVLVSWLLWCCIGYCFLFLSTPLSILCKQSEQARARRGVGGEALSLGVPWERPLCSSRTLPAFLMVSLSEDNAKVQKIIDIGGLFKKN